MLNGARPRVVILGAGFGGLAAARGLAGAEAEVTLVDRQNHHLFQPLLYQVATAGLSETEIAAPIRSILKHQKNTRVLLDEVVGIDMDARQVRLNSGRTLGYDRLVVATGARHSYLGHPEWECNAPGLKTIDDALQVRRAVLLAMERAETETDRAKRDALLTFIVVGGGPTGVEMAGAIAELARTAVSMEFRSITPRCSRILLVDAGARLLRSFPEPLSAVAERDLRGLGVEVRLGLRITQLHGEGLRMGDDLVRAGTIVWAAGVMASPAASWLGVEPDGSGRVPVDDQLRPSNRPDVWVIGDTAATAGPDGRGLPGIASIAQQQGRYTARAIRRELAGKVAEPFRYRRHAMMATIGRSRAIADFGWIRLSGVLAWLLWCTVHIYFLVSFRSRLAVGFTWFWNYLTFQRHARLITGLDRGPPT